MNEQWSEILVGVREAIGEKAFSIWFGQAQLLSMSASRIVIEVPNRFYMDWILDNYGEALHRETERVLGVRVPLEFALLEEREARTGAGPTTGFQNNLIPEMTFESFILGDSNKFAAAAAENVAENPASNYNPLYIFSDVGLGKTHLLHAIGNRAMQLRPDMRVLYVRAEDFFNEMIDGLQTKSLQTFQQRYRQNVDLLLVDDVQFFTANKTRTSDEFFHTFNALHMARKQIVLAADKKPHELEGIEERLKSRFSMGLTADIQYPDNETKMSILLKRARDGGTPLSQDVAFLIASRVTGNVRDLLGASKRVYFYAQQQRPRGEELTVDLARNVLDEYLGEQQRSLTVEGIAAAVATFFNVQIKELRGPSRRRIFSQARHVAMYLARTLCGTTYEAIGEFYNRDHSTVIEAVRTVEQRLKDDRRVAEQVESIEKSLRELGT